MKFYAVFGLFLLFSLAVKAQKDTSGLNLPVKDGKVVYEQIIDVPGKKATELYTNAKQWFVDYFKSAKDVIQSEDKESGRIVGKGIFIIQLKSLGISHPYFDKATIQIDCKDGKYRVRLYDFNIIQDTNFGNAQSYATTPELLIAKLADNGHSPYSKGQCRQLLENSNYEALAAISSLQKNMNNNTDNF